MQAQSQSLKQQNVVALPNPQIPQIRCRICYSEIKPLIALCQCSGSMGYVHQQCILDWIGRKMQRYQGLHLPQCEICRMPYSARLRLGSRKICHTTLWLKISLLTLGQKWRLIYYLIGTLVCILLVGRLMMQTLSIIFAVISKSETTEFTKILREKPIQTTFTHCILTCSFMREAINHILKYKRLVEQSYIQVIDFIIEPKQIIK